MERLPFWSICFVLFCVTFFIYATRRSQTNFSMASSFYKYSAIDHMSDNFSSEDAKILDSSCIAMFDIGFDLKLNQSSTNVNSSFIYEDILDPKDWTQLLKEKEAASQSYENYLPFVNSVASRISKLSNSLWAVKNGTRLQMMNGELPYIPCKINDYGKEDLRLCLSKYREKNKKLWISFFGDSRIRNMFLFFIKRTNEIKKWKIDKEKEKNLILKNILNNRDHSNGINATSSHGDLISFVPAKNGLKNNADHLNPDRPRDYLFNLLKLNDTLKPLPDLLITSFGIHDYILFLNQSIFDRHDKIIDTWKEMSNILNQLSKKMNVLSLYQTKPRDYLQTLYGRKKLSRSSSHSFHEHILMNYGSRFVDNVMREVNRHSNVIQWDSTFPFNLASSEECKGLINQNYFLIDEEIKNSTPFQSLMCHDRIHKSRSTVQDETTLLLNLICNKIMSMEQFYCCS